MSCADCRSEFDLVRSIELAGAEAGAAARPGRRWMAPLALAASRAARGRDRPVRPASGARARRGPVRRGAAAAARCPHRRRCHGRDLRCLFAWHPVPGGGRYRLEVMNAAGEVALEAETADTVDRLRGRRPRRRRLSVVGRRHRSPAVARSGSGPFASEIARHAGQGPERAASRRSTGGVGRFHQRHLRRRIAHHREPGPLAGGAPRRARPASPRAAPPPPSAL